MLVLAIDTATPAVTAGLVEVTGDAVLLRSARVEHDARKHAELLMPAVQAVCADAGTPLAGVDAVVVGTGPGPFTGLRVGMVTAAALGDALGVPVHGVCSLDAIAADAEGDGPLLVVTDARRREVYWAAYDSARRRVDGPHVQAPAEVAARAAELGVAAAAGASAGLVGLPARPPESPSPAGLVTVAAGALRAGAAPGPLEPLYLRRPDATEPGARKRVNV
ncbi:tRNA (adenosine(37)-N6)-threonylcarbamoyltransferase complex dimerization subunit type 1 TsaB [Pseudonocardia sp. MH-G8]|uniref:tRNA (adenosine(37)-N6)-threonylcarbamoyltransferase complex dimerization subunit type 1 TsaB n=1 Tax=Pseudonocardia sp. MH-G8 TaxID=1854588 RepID=UPI000BA0CC30|nr:tRNA (adenosine(37)-N6)-threonylcarbamoyltransferase complex dimerization subunit type 1 TsaB [Pseudonocardia sp. MH-G8]OZM80583.1 tRNA (adenosine(37)-N6)-threonylcarbamoyltransferase complex dimerization subunit type 1 TsaB [Pseudonocardia sp. MH-G8]